MIYDLLKLCYDRGASDIHFKIGYPPILRVDGRMEPLTKMKIIDARDYDSMLMSILDDFQLFKFKQNKKLDLGYSFGNARYRVNLFYDLNGGSAVFRMIPFMKLDFEDIALPKAARNMGDRPFGLILVTGATGSGKSTTLSCFINHINSTRPCNILTIEDPNEYFFEDSVGIVNQRQVGVDCRSFEEGIAGGLHTDCDVIMVGELRNSDAVNMTLSAAECGKLVFSTLHSNTAMQAIDRFVNLFPQTAHAQVLGRMSTTLVGIISQTLCLKKNHKGRVAAFEMLVGTPTIRGLIAENRIHLVQSYLETGSESGMCTLDQALAQLIMTGQISVEEGLLKCAHQGNLKKLIEQYSGKGDNEGQ
jgi:twitching motility protein PilT